MNFTRKKGAQGGGKSFMAWYAAMVENDTCPPLTKILNAATYSSKENASSRFVARFDGVWDLGSTSSSIGILEKYVSSIKNRRLRHCLLDCDKVIFQSKFSREGAYKYFRDVISMPETVICNPVRTNEEWSGAWRSTLRMQAPIRIVCYHRHTPLKCSYLAVEFAKRLAGVQSRPIELTIIGGAPALVERRIQRAIVANSDCRVQVNRVAGDLDAFVKYALNASFVLNLAHFDPCPNVVCEAVGLGVPQIVVASGGIPEILGDGYEYYLNPFAIHRSWLVENTVEKVDWVQFFDVASNILSLEHSRNIYEYAVEHHNPSSIYNAYKLFIG
jgi:glycosyltransferase involved in cell wall biosynthesis